MDLVAFFRMAIPIVLALFCVGLILAINVIFFGNAFYILKNSFQKKKNIVVAKEELSRIKGVNNEEARSLKQTMPKAS